MSSAPTVALATYANLPELAPDDQLLVATLQSLGVRAIPAVWDDATIDWGAFNAVVLRSCWDYHLRLDAFLGWVRSVHDRGVALWNPPAVIGWNARKTYLRDLAAIGVSTVPTRWITGSSSSAPGALVRILEDAGWDEAVVKPVVSASAYNTWRVSRDDAAARAAEHDARIRELVGREGVMVQPYLPEFERDGEWSLIFFDGILSHAVVKRAAPGEFRVQRKYGARFETAVPPREIALQAHAAVGASPERPLYARVDGVVVGTTLVVTELELLEPSLFLDADPAAPERFANAIVGALVRRQPE